MSLATGIFIFLLSACSSLPPSAQQYNNFAEYAEAVFRHQNRLISRLMMMTDADVLPEDDRFDEAEQSMNEACHLLNEYAEHESNGEWMGPIFKHRVQDSIENCDMKIHKLENMLVELDKAPNAAKNID
ncbi:MAG: hypothetical protein ACU836_14320 [Gammaproteobacteria bacterium]